MAPALAARCRRALIDPAALTRLSARRSPVAEVTAATVAAGGRHHCRRVAGRRRRRPRPGQAALPGGHELPALPQLAEAEPTTAPTEEDVGPIGRYVRGDGSDGKVVLTDGDDIFVGGDGDEHVVGGAGDDYLDGAGGDDQLEGGTGDDTLLGGSGDDLLEGQAGDDLLDGGIGDDRLLGGAGDDQLLGGGGDDFLNGGSGIDRLEGGTGNEILVLADVRDAVTELGLGIDEGGNDTVVVADSYGASLAAALPGTGGRATFVLGRPDVAHFPTDVAGFRQQIDPDIENIRLEGSKAHDVVGDDRASLIIGNDGANRIHAGGGDDSVLGGGGDDWIDGGDGDDWLDGGLGGDTIYGGGGDDVFVFGLHEDGDLIFDHEGRNTLRIAGADPGQGPGRAAGRRPGRDPRRRGRWPRSTAMPATPTTIAGIDLGQGVAAHLRLHGRPRCGRGASAVGDRRLAGRLHARGGQGAPSRCPSLEWARGSSGLRYPRRRRRALTRQPTVRRGRRCGLPAEFAALRPTRWRRRPISGLPVDDLAGAPGRLPADRSATRGDLWLPVDDMAGMPTEGPVPDRYGEERPSTG